MPITWSPQARRDLINICTRVLADDPAAAALALDRIEAEVLDLLDDARAGGVGRLDGTRELVAGDLPYRVTKSGVEVIRVLHGGEDRPPDD